jgi:hypothetical protein
MADDVVDIAGIDKAVLLAALVNGSSPMGMGFLQDRGGMTVDEAREWIDNGWDHDFHANNGTPGRNRGDRLYFDYVQGRPLKIDIGGDTADAWGFDRDHGKGALRRLVDEIKASV